MGYDAFVHHTECRFHAMLPSPNAQAASMTHPPRPSSAEAGAPRGLGRLWQPRRGLFWLMVLANLLSSFWGWLLRSDTLSPLGLAVVAVLALGNVVAGMWLAWRLLRGD